MALLTFIAGEPVSANDIVFVDPNGLIFKASSAYSSQATAVGVCIDSGAQGSGVRVNGDNYCTTFSGLTPGTDYYISITSSGQFKTYTAWASELSTSSLSGAFLTSVGRAATTSGMDIEFSTPLFINRS